MMDVVTTKRATAMTMLVAILGLSGLVGCGSDTDHAATSTTAAFLQPSSPSIEASTTSSLVTTVASGTPTDTAAPTGGTDVVPVEPAPAIPSLTPSTPAPPPVVSLATPPCAGATAIPAGATAGEQIVGNVDGDDVDDTVTAYTAGDGTQHVFLQRGGANGSDVALDLGDTGGTGAVSISFENVDYSIGAEVPPPLAVLVIASGPTASAVATLLSQDTTDSHCLRQWRSNGSAFTFTIDQRGPFSGLLCDGAAGRRFYVLRTATPDGAGMVVVTAQEIDHNGINVTLVRLGDETVPDDEAVAHNFGDIQNCDHPPLFPG